MVEVGELKIEHVLLFVIVAFLLYHLMGRCGMRSRDGFSVGGVNCDDLTLVKGCEQGEDCRDMCKNIPVGRYASGCEKYKYYANTGVGKSVQYQCKLNDTERTCNGLTNYDSLCDNIHCTGQNEICESTLQCCKPPPGNNNKHVSCVETTPGGTGLCKWF
jgi:hypothetical protein